MKNSGICKLLTMLVVTAMLFSMLSMSAFATTPPNCDRVPCSCGSDKIMVEEKYSYVGEIRFNESPISPYAVFTCCTNATYQNGSNRMIVLTENGTYDGYIGLWKKCSVCGSDNLISETLAKTGMTLAQGKAWMNA